jgi:hypothetical protein
VSFAANSAPEYGEVFQLFSATGQVEFNNPLPETNMVGILSPESSGLDSPEIREDYADSVEDDGGTFGLFFAGKRPIVLQGTILATSPTQRNEKLARLQMALFGMLRENGILAWSPAGGTETVKLEVRLGGRFVVTKGFVKEFQIPLVAAEPRKFGFATKEAKTFSSVTSANKFTTAAANVTGPGTINWVTPTNAQGTTDSVYTATEALGAGVKSKFLACTGFGLAIPAEGNITGIQFTALGKGSIALRMTAAEVFALKAGVAAGTNIGTGVSWPAVATSFAFGGINNLLGTTWTPAQVNAANFGVEISVKGEIEAAKAEVDSVRVNVTYNTPAIASVNNEGNYETPMKVKIFGPVFGAFTVKNITTGKKVVFSANTPLELGNAHYVEIDFGKKTIKLDGVTDLYPSYQFPESEWWELGPGVNEIELPRGSEMISTWNNAWM